MLGAYFLKFLKFHLFGKYRVHVHVLFRPKKVIFKTVAKTEIDVHVICTAVVRRRQYCSCWILHTCIIGYKAGTSTSATR